MVALNDGPIVTPSMTMVATAGRVRDVFTPQTRAIYSLERLWGDAERIEISDEGPPPA